MIFADRCLKNYTNKAFMFARNIIATLKKSKKFIDRNSNQKFIDSYFSIIIERC